MVANFLKNGRRLILSRQTSILSAAIIIMVAYTASGLLGVLRNRLLAQHFFSGREALLDSYFVAFVLPDTIFQLLILGALSASFIPVFTESLRKDKNEAWHIVNSAITGILLMFLILSVVLFIFAYPASRLLAPNFSPELSQTTASLIRIMLAAQFFFALSSFMTGIIQSHHHFLIPAVAPVFYNLGIIFGIIALSPVMGIFGPAVGVIIGALLHFAVQLPLAFKLGFRWKLSADWKHPSVVRMFRLMPARAATLALGQLEKVIAVMITSASTAGTIAIFNFARQLYVLPVSIFGATVGQASFPVLSHAREESREKFAAAVSATLLQLVFFALPAAALLLVLRIPVVRLAFGSKEFPWEATLLTGRAVALFAISVPAQAANQLLIRSFYASQNTKIPLGTTIISTGLLIILAPTLATSFGVLGVVLAIVVADIVNACLLTMLLNRLIVPGLIMMISRPLIKILLATALMGISLWIPLRLLDKFVFDTTKTLSLIGLTGMVSVIGLGVYLLLAKILRIDQLQSVVKILEKIGNWKEILSESEEVLEPTAGES